MATYLYLLRVVYLTVCVSPKWHTCLFMYECLETHNSRKYAKNISISLIIINWMQTFRSREQINWLIKCYHCHLSIRFFFMAFTIILALIGITLKHNWFAFDFFILPQFHSVLLWNSLIPKKKKKQLFEWSLIVGLTPLFTVPAHKSAFFSIIKEARPFEWFRTIKKCWINWFWFASIVRVFAHFVLF